MVQTAREESAWTWKADDGNLEFDIGHDSVMTVRIICGARATVTPEALSQRAISLVREWKLDPDRQPSREGIDV
jgi:hypothetical protein